MKLRKKADCVAPKDFFFFLPDLDSEVKTLPLSVSNNTIQCADTAIFQTNLFFLDLYKRFLLKQQRKVG